MSSRVSVQGVSAWASLWASVLVSATGSWQGYAHSSSRAGLMLHERNPILAVKSSVKCPSSHERKRQRTSCGHLYCEVCAGYVDPATRVLFSKPSPTAWCNRKPAPRSHYEYWLAEHGCGRPRLLQFDQRSSRGIPKARIAPFVNLALAGEPMEGLLDKDRLGPGEEGR